MRRLLTVITALALALGAASVIALPAKAVQAPVAFTAKALPTWQTNGVAWRVASANGLVFVGGTFTSIRPPGAVAGTDEVPRSNFAVLDAATGAPTDCAPEFTVGSPATPTGATVRALSVSPDQKTLYVGGFFSRVNGVTNQHLAAIDIASCTLVPNFKPLPTGIVHVAVSTDDAVYYGGQFISAGNPVAERRKAAAAAAVGTATPGAMLPWAPSFDTDVRALTLNPDKSVVAVGGDFDTVNGASSHALAVVNATDGANVRTYPGNFIHPNSVVKDLTSDATGFYTGNEGTGGGVFDGRIALNWSDYNQRWRDTCLGATQAVVVYQGVLYSASHAHDCASMGSFPDGERQHFLAQTVDDPTLLGWFPDTNEGIGEGIGPRGMVVAETDAQDYMWSVGEFTSVNGVRQQGITRFGQGPGSAAPSTPTTSASSVRPGQAQISWRTSLDLDDATLTYNVYRDNSATPIHTTTATSWFWDRPQLSFTDTNQLLGSTHTYRVGVTDGDNTVYSPWRSVTIASTVSNYAERVAADGANLLWRFDEASDTFFADYTGSGGSGTLLGSATYQVAPGAIAGDPSRAIGLPGSSTIHTGNVRPSPSTYSVETWFKTTSTSGGKLIGFGNRQTDNSSSYDKHVYMQNNGRLTFGVYTGSTVTINSTDSYNDGAWHHVVATQGSDGMALYVDGRRVARGSTTTNENITGYWRVGGDNLNSWPNRPSSDYFDGNLDETAVYPSALSPSTVAEHYVLAGGTLAPGNTGPTDNYGRAVFGDDPSLYWRLAEASGSTAADTSGSGVTGRYYNGVTRNQTGAIDGTNNPAVRLSGTSNGLISSSSASPSPGAFSTELWFKTNSSSTNGKIIGFGNQQSNNSNSYDRHVYMTSNGRLVFGTNGSAGQQTITTSASYRDGSFHHLVATQGPSGMALYVDGVLVGTNAATNGENINGYWRVGGDRVSGWPDAPSSSYFNGTIDEVAVYPKALTAAKVAGHYSSGNEDVPDAAAPTTPTGLTVGMAAGSAELSWNASIDNVGVTGYQVHRSTTLGFTPSAETLVGSPTGTAYTDTSAPAGIVYYRVLAQDAAGNLSDASIQYSVFVPDVVAPSAPVGVTVNATSSSAAVSWDAATDNIGVAQYEVYRSATPDFVPGPANLVTTTTSTDVVDSPLALGTWYYCVKAKDASGNLSESSAEVSGVVADTTAPTAPSDVVTAVAGSTVQVSWTESTDDAGTPTYRVHRSSTSGFTPEAGNQVGTSATGSFSDSPVSSGIWFYRVVAVDGAGNISAASTEVQTVVAPAPSAEPLTPIADTYANQGATTTNYGSTASLASRGNIGAVSYLRFLLPTPAAGRTLTSATLQVRTTTDSFAGSVEPHNVSLAGNSWGESTLNWTNRPAITGSPIGTIAGGTSPNSVVTTPLNPAALQTPGEVTLAVTNSGTDNLWFWSRNHTNASYRPVLTLTYSEADLAPPLKPAGLAATVDGYSADLTWDVPLDNVGVTGYDLHRSNVSGFVPSPSTLVASPPAPSYEDGALTAGTWYYRVVAKDAAGNASAASNQLAVVVADITAPSVPNGFVVEGTPTSASLTWAGSTDNVAGAIEYDVHRSQTNGFVAGASNLVTTVNEPSYEDSPLALGTWYYRVVAKDAAGNASAPSAQVAAVVADTTAPTVPSNVATSVDGVEVTVTWSASGDDVAVSGYDVYRSTDSAFTPSVATLVGSASGAQYVDTAAPPGTLYYRVVAKDSAGNRSDASETASAVVIDTVAPSAPTEVTATVSGASVEVEWTASTDNGVVATYDVHRSSTEGFTPDGSTLVGSSSTTTYVDEPVTVGTWYYRVIAHDSAGNTGAASDEASAVVNDVTPPTVPAGVTTDVNGSTVDLSWTASTDAGSVAGYEVHRSATSGFTPSAATLVGSPAGTSYSDTSVDTGTWYYRVIAVDGDGNRSAASVEADAIVGDTTAPTKARDLVAIPSGSDVELTWTASTDAVGVVGYDVYRSATSGFTPAAGSLVGTSTGASYDEEDVPAGTWYYRVVAKDAAGNRSDESAQTSVVVAPGSPVVVDLTPTADTYANQGATSVNYGSTASLASRGSVGAVSYLRFQLPAAPAGTTLTGASLRLRTTADSFAGSAETHRIAFASDAWTESTLNWLNRPAVPAGSIGTIAAGTTPSTVFTTSLQAPALLARGAGSVTLAITNSGTDNLWFQSSNHANAGFRPQLTLTYGADTTAPSAATALVASADGDDVDLTWSAATDDVGVAGYDVYRSASSGFTPGASTWIGAVSDTSYSDKSVASGTWYYRVVARDGSGNRGAATAVATATVS